MKWCAYLEFVEIHVECTVESEGGSDGRHNLGNHPVEIGVAGSLNVEIPSADIVDGLIVDHEGTVGMLEGGVGGKDGVVRLNHGGGDLRCRVDIELELALLPEVNRDSLHEERGEARAGASSERVEDKEALETGTLIGQFPDSVQDNIDELLADSVVTTSVVVGCIFL